MKILIISPAWIGDMVMSNSLYQLLKQQDPNCQINVLAPKWCEPLLARMPEVNQALIMPLGHGEFNLAKRYQIGKNLRKQYDLAIVLPNSLKSALIPLFAKISMRRGWKGESRYGLLNDLRTNRKAYPMMVQRYMVLGFAKHEVPKAEDLKIIFPKLAVDSKQIAITQQDFHEILNNEVNRKIIGFSAGAEYGPAKRWPHYHFAKLAEILINQNCAIRLFGSEKDRKVNQMIINSLPTELQPFCVNLAGKTNLNQAVDLIADCKALVTNDSGLMHIACAVNIPVLALYGPTDPSYTPPLSSQAKIIRLIEGKLQKIRQTDLPFGYHQSLIDIKPEITLTELQKLISL